MTPSTVSEVLTAAADLIEKPGAWTQEALCRTESGEPFEDLISNACSWCVIGAINAALPEATKPELRKVTLQVERLLGLNDGGLVYPLAAWNDAPERTQAEVVSALRTAAKASEVGS